MPWDPPGRAGGSVWGEGSLGVPAQAAAPATWPGISGRKWMDGWMDGWMDKLNLKSYNNNIKQKKHILNSVNKAKIGERKYYYCPDCCLHHHYHTERHSVGKTDYLAHITPSTAPGTLIAERCIH